MTSCNMRNGDVFVSIEAKDFLMNGGFSSEQADAIIKVTAGIQQGILDEDLSVRILTRDGAFPSDQATSLARYFSSKLAA